MGRRLRLLNLTLGLVAVLIAAALAKTWVTPASSVSSPSAPKPSQDPLTLAFIPTARPPLAQFDVLLEKNPFKQPPPTPVGRGPAPPPLPPPPPLPTLVGTILVDDERRAILSDKGKANIYSIGQEVGGGALTGISEDRVQFKRGDATMEIMLKASIQPGAAAPPPGAQPLPSPAPPAGMFVPPSPPPPPAIEGGQAPSSRSVRDPSALERRQQRQIERSQRRQNRQR